MLLTEMAIIIRGLTNTVDEVWFDDKKKGFEGGQKNHTSARCLHNIPNY
jgi:hypothetical protein